jgi:hypothetical protein
MSQQSLTDRTALARHRLRHAAAPALFLHEIAAGEIEDRLSVVNKRFTSPALVTGHPEFWQGRFPHAEVVSDEDTLALEPGAPLQRAVRLRSLENDTFSYLITHVPGEIAERYTQDELKTEPMLELLKRAGAEAVEADQTLTAVAADPQIAAALKVSPGAPLLKIKRIMRGRDGRAVQHIIAYYRPERFRYHMRLVRKESGDTSWGDAELA